MSAKQTFALLYGAAGVASAIYTVLIADNGGAILGPIWFAQIESSDPVVGWAILIGKIALTVAIVPALIFGAITMAAVMFVLLVALYLFQGTVWLATVSRGGALLVSFAVVVVLVAAAAGIRNAARRRHSARTGKYYSAKGGGARHESEADVDRSRQRTGSAQGGESTRETRINRDTGVIEEKHWNGWASATNSEGREERMNPDTGGREEKHWTGWSPVANSDNREGRVNVDTGVREEKHWTGWNPQTNSDGRNERVNPITGVREEKHWSGWTPVTNSDGREERINPETDVLEEKRWTGWAPKGS